MIEPKSQTKIGTKTEKHGIADKPTLKKGKTTHQKEHIQTDTKHQLFEKTQGDKTRWNKRDLSTKCPKKASQKPSTFPLPFRFSAVLGRAPMARLLLCSRTREYRRMASLFKAPKPWVLEIGCHEGGPPFFGGEVLGVGAFLVVFDGVLYSLLFFLKF